MVAETDKAILVKVGDKEHWLPKSQLDHDYNTKTITVRYWLAVKREFV